MVASVRGRRPSLVPAIIAAVASVLLGLCWALASPLSGTPDENFHLATIWCSWGDDTPQCRLERVEGARRIVDVPALEGYGPCFAFNADVSAACQPGPDPAATGFVEADNGSYPTGFYRVMGLMAGDNAGTSAVLMRMASYLACTTMLFCAALLLPFGRRARARVLLVVTAVAIPLGVYLFASVNPSGVAVAAEIALFLSSLAAMMARTWRRSLGAGVFGAGMVLVAASARPDGVYLSVVVLALAAAATVTRRTLLVRDSAGPVPTVIWAGLPILAALILAWLARPTTVQDSLVQGTQGEVSLVGNLLNIPGLYIGDFPTTLGWLDTHLPAGAWALQALILGMLVAIAMTRPDGRRWWALGVATALLVVIPLLWLSMMGARVGEWVQPRYLLPLLLAASVLTVVPLPRSRIRISRAQAVVIATFASIVNAIALHTLLRRYISGLDVGSPDLGQAVEWWWGGPAGPRSLWIVGAVAALLMLGALADMATTSWRDADSQPLESPRGT